MLGFTPRKKIITIGIAASVLLAVALGIMWHEMHGFSIHRGHPTTVAAASLVQKAMPAHAAVSAQTPAGTVTTSAPSTAAATPTSANSSNAPLKQQSSAAQQSTVQIVDSPSTSATTDKESGAKPAQESPVPKVEADANTTDSDPSAPEPAKHRRTDLQNGPALIPAKILSQSQPAIPAWAKDLDVDSVVQLDALIDEKGNVTETKVLSGPRVLQRAAQDAVALWIFQPALQDGKPTATHMVLTVQFQR